NMLAEYSYTAVPSRVHDGWMIKPKTTAEDRLVVEAKLNGGTPVALPSATTSQAADLATTRWFLQADVEEYMAFEGEPWRSAAIELMKNHKAMCYFVAIVRHNPEIRPSFQGFLIFPADCKIQKIDLPKLLGDSILPTEFPWGDFKHSFPDAS